MPAILSTLRQICIPLACLCVLAPACRNGSDNDDGPDPSPGGGDERPVFRAITGVSMGAYGAMNIGTKHPDLFSAIGALGGPVDMMELLQLADDLLAVEPRAELAREAVADFTFDHALLYPGRDTQLRMFQDLFLAFGNPFLHHPDASRRYLASDSEPAAKRTDDTLGDFTLPGNPRGFLDGGDQDKDGLRQVGEAPDEPTDVFLLAGGSLTKIAGVNVTPVTLGERQLADLDGDGVFDVGDGIVKNAREPFNDANANGRFDAGGGEPFLDAGLDGVAGTLDFGEANGRFDEDPDIAAWIEEDPLTRLAGRSVEEIEAQRIYMDVGTRDELQFARHYANLVQMLKAKGVQVEERDGFPGSCLDVRHPEARHLLVRYDGGHIGIPDADEVTQDLLAGDFCGPTLVWQRLVTLLGFLDAGFPDGVRGASGPDLTGNVDTTTLLSPALRIPGGLEVGRRVVVYRPPAFFNTTARFPVVYFLGGYGQSPEDFERMGLLLDGLIVTGQIQNMFFAFLPGEGGNQGSFYADHRVPAEQAPNSLKTTGRYETSILEDLIPVIESDLLEGRVKE